MQNRVDKIRGRIDRFSALPQMQKMANIGEVQLIMMDTLSVIDCLVEKVVDIAEEHDEIKMKGYLD